MKFWESKVTYNRVYFSNMFFSYITRGQWNVDNDKTLKKMWAFEKLSLSYWILFWCHIIEVNFNEKPRKLSNWKESNYREHAVFLQVYTLFIS